jgi:hypothetical protein
VRSKNASPGAYIRENALCKIKTPNLNYTLAYKQLENVNFVVAKII